MVRSWVLLMVLHALVLVRGSGRLEVCKRCGGLLENTINDPIGSVGQRAAGFGQAYCSKIDGYKRCFGSCISDKLNDELALFCREDCRLAAIKECQGNGSTNICSDYPCYRHCVTTHMATSCPSPLTSEGGLIAQGYLLASVDKPCLLDYPILDHHQSGVTASASTCIGKIADCLGEIGYMIEFKQSVLSFSSGNITVNSYEEGSESCMKISAVIQCLRSLNTPCHSVTAHLHEYTTVMQRTFSPCFPDLTPVSATALDELRANCTKGSEVTTGSDVMKPEVTGSSGDTSAQQGGSSSYLGGSLQLTAAGCIVLMLL